MFSSKEMINEFKEGVKMVPVIYLPVTGLLRVCVCTNLYPTTGIYTYITV